MQHRIALVRDVRWMQHVELSDGCSMHGFLIEPTEPNSGSATGWSQALLGCALANSCGSWGGPELPWERPCVFSWLSSEWIEAVVI